MKPKIKLILTFLLISSTIFYRGCPIKGTPGGFFSFGFPFPFFDILPFTHGYILWPSIVVNVLFYALCIFFIIRYKDKKRFDVNGLFLSTIITVSLHHLLWIASFFRITFYFNIFTMPIYLINSFVGLFHILHPSDNNISARVYFILMLLFFYLLKKIRDRIIRKKNNTSNNSDTENR